MVEFMYLAFTCMPGESYCRRLGSLLLCLFDAFRALINCWCVCLTSLEHWLTPLCLDFSKQEHRFSCLARPKDNHSFRSQHNHGGSRHCTFIFGYRTTVSTTGSGQAWWCLAAGVVRSATTTSTATRRLASTFCMAATPQLGRKGFASFITRV